MFGKLISEETEQGIANAVRVAALAKALESVTAAMKNTDDGALHSELNESADDLNKKMKETIAKL